MNNLSMAHGVSGAVDDEYERVELGRTDDIDDLPETYSIGERDYFLVRNTDGAYHLLSNVCPHMGGLVQEQSDRFECPVHGWTFDKQTGKCLNASKERLTRYDVHVRDDRLIAELPAQLLRSRFDQREGELSVPFELSLHAHACLQIEKKDFSLLLDPWLDGPAFMGAWTQFPPAVTDGSDLDPDALWITHEHSDHFHEGTLDNFDRKTPIYVPDFPNGRMVDRTKDLGFVDVRAVPFGETCTLDDDLQVTCFEPASLWNDSILLIEIGNFRILNISDAGLNQRVADRVSSVDLVASSYSWGASGYPCTWTHFSEEEMREVMGEACRGMLEMVRAAVNQYSADYFLPFASYFSLWHPSHREFLDLLDKNTIEDVEQALKGTDTEVVDLLPGETWDAAADRYERLWNDREKVFPLTI